MKRLFIGMILVISLSPALAAWKVQERTWLTRRAIVLTTENDYNKAMVAAKLAAKNLGVEWQERELVWDGARQTLSFSPEDCQARGLGEYPCYLARGVDDWLNYVSIELAAAYENLPAGKLVVLAGIYRELGPQATKEQALYLEQVRAKYPKAMELEVKVFKGVLGQVQESF